MDNRYCIILCISVALLLSGCAGRSTDPRAGGIFSYNPDAYEQRLQERQGKLEAIRHGNESLQEESSQLEAEQLIRNNEKEAISKELKKSRAAVALLEKNIKSKQAKTTAQKKEQKRLLKEAQSITVSTQAADSVVNPDEKRQELERLKSRRDKLEKEAADLMRL